MNRYFGVLLLLLVTYFSNGQVVVDTVVGTDAPKSAGDYKEMTHILCDGLRGDQQKANAIYNWVTHNIRYDVEQLKKGKLEHDKADKVFKTRLGVCEGYAKLYTAMCNEAGLKAVTIDGYAKDWIFDNGDQLIIPRHAWCAVLVNAQWQLVEPTWGAGNLVQSQTFWRKVIDKITFKKMRVADNLKFRFRYDPQYFLQDPLTFRIKHLPIDPCWQLTDTAMPLSVFEAGDSAIHDFNKKYNQLKQNSAELMRIAGLEEDSVIYDAMERAYNFNNRFSVALALRQIAYVKEDVNNVLKEEDPDKGQELWTDAQKRLKFAETHVKDQRKYFPDQYAILKRKNGVKNNVAKQGMMHIRMDDRQLLGQCKKYQNSCNSKMAGYRRKQQDLKRKASEIYKGDIHDKIGEGAPRPLPTEEMKAIVDDLNARQKNIDSLNKELGRRMVAIEIKKDTNILLLDTLSHCLKLSDSFLMEEARTRMNMKDNYDDELVKWVALFTKEKYHTADTLHKYYMANFDSVVQMTEARHKVYLAMFDEYKHSIKGIERYAKFNASDTGVTAKYLTVVTDYVNAIDTCNQELAAAAQYVRSNARLFNSLGKLYTRQLKIVDYMWQVENMRKKLELNAIVHNQQFDMKENKVQANSIKAAQKVMGRGYQ